MQSLLWKKMKQINCEDNSIWRIVFGGLNKNVKPFGRYPKFNQLWDELNFKLIQFSKMTVFNCLHQENGT